MATTGFLLPTTDAAVSGSWTNAANVQADDGSIALCNIAAKNTTAIREQGGFGFTTGVLPDDATISQVNLRVEWRIQTSASVIAILGVRARVTTTDLTIHENAAEPTTLTTETFDITAERAWVPADFRDGTFKTRLEPRNGNDASDPSYEFDFVAVEVVYTTPVTHAASGALSGPGSVVAGAAQHNIPHPSSGALIGPGSTLNGTAARTREHAADGALVGQGAVVVGAADRQEGGAPVTHATSGVLVGPGSAVAGSAARTRVHAATGVLAGPGAVVVGAAAREGSPVEHAASGALVGSGALVAGAALRGSGGLADNPANFMLGLPRSDTPAAPAAARRDQPGDRDFQALSRMVEVQSYLDDVEQWMADQLEAGEELADLNEAEGLEMDEGLTGNRKRRTGRRRA